MDDTPDSRTRTPSPDRHAALRAASSRLADEPGLAPAADPAASTR